jgi:hypothetical protein
VRGRALALVLLLGGCGVRPTGVVYAGDAPVATAPAAPTAPVYFLEKEQPTPVTRAVDPVDVQGVYDVLLQGPSAAEHAAGLRTELDGVKQISIRDLGDRQIYIEVIPPTASLTQGAYAQLYCTAVTLDERPIMKIAAAGTYGVQCPGGLPAASGMPAPPGKP